MSVPVESGETEPRAGLEPFRAVSYPWRLYAGAGALDNLPAEVDRHGSRRAFVICGRTVAHRTNLLQRIRDCLGERYAGVFDRMDKDSSYPAVLAATEAAREVKADLVIAAGGGSTIVGARVAVILLAEQGSAYELMTQYPEGKPPFSPRLLAPKLPIINVPTTPTTAMNRAGSGLKNDELDHRMEFFDPKTRPVALFWDAEALLTAPLSLARSTGTTTFTSSLQSVAAGSENPLVEGDQLQAFQLARRALPRLLAEPDNAMPRIDLCAAALLLNRAADDGAAREGRDRVSGTAYALATAIHVFYDGSENRTAVGQGEATSAVFPSIWRRLAGAAIDQQSAGARRMAQSLHVWQDGMTLQGAADAASGALEAFYRSIGMPARLRDLHIPESDLPLLAPSTLKNFNANRDNRPAGYLEQMTAMLRACW